MTRMIISPEQLKAINEAALTYVNDMNPSTLINATNNAQGNSVTAKVAGGTGPKQAVTLPGLKTGSETVNPNASSVEITKDPTKDNQTNGMFENRFSKRQVELGRMLEMRRTGKVFSKKQLNEMFMETQENAKRLRKGIGKCKLNDIFDAIEEIFPEEIDGVKDAFMNGADLPEYICSIFSNDDVNGEKEEMFLERLGIKK